MDRPIPFRYRLPNPPAVFEGRERELAWVRDALGRGPVVVVAGPAGIGKGALVRRTLHGPGPARRIVHLELPSHHSNLETRTELVRALATAAGVEPSVVGRQHDPEALTQTAIELSEDHGLWISLERRHTRLDPEWDEMLTMIARFARASRWLVTCASVPRAPDLAGQTLILGGLPTAVMHALAAAWAPHLAAGERSTAVTRATGSPFFLQQWLGAAPDAESPLEGLSAPACRALKVLTLIGGGASGEVLDAVIEDETADVLELLAGRGLVQRRPGGWSSHEIVRGLLPLSAAERVELARRTAGALRNARTPEAWLLALRMSLESNDRSRAGELVRTRAEALLAHGYAPAIWSMVRDSDDPELANVRLRCAAELGNPTAIAAVAGVWTGEEEALLWAQTLAARGALRSALHEAEQLIDSQDLTSRREAAILACELRQRLGRYDDARLLLGFVGPRSPEGRALKTRAQVMGAELSAARAHLEELSGTSTEQVGERVLLMVAEVYLVASRVSALLGLLERLETSPRGTDDVFLVARRARLIEARAHTARGSRDCALDLLEGLRPYARGESMLRPWIELLEAELLEVELPLAEVPSDFECAAARAAHSIRMDLGEGRAPSSRLLSDLQGGGVPMAEVALWERIAAARHGSLDPRSSPPTTVPRLEVLAALERATTLVVGGQAEAALPVIETGLTLARKVELARLRGELLALGRDATFIAKDAERAALWARELRQLASDSPWPSLVSDADFADALSRGLSWSLAERIAEREDRRAPARRMRAWLGDHERACDRVDRAFLGALRSERGRVRSIGEPGDAANAWGLDLGEQRIWTREGEVDLSSRPMLFAILRELARAGGHLDKEALLRGVWKTDEYHPLRHDPKLHTAIGKLRRLIEVDPKEPRLLLTSDAGYHLAPPLRIAHRPEAADAGP